MTTTHTPGTWLFKGDEIYIEETGRTLARLAGYGTDADGKLMAAAPQLRAVLQVVSDQLNFKVLDKEIQRIVNDALRLCHD